MFFDRPRSGDICGFNSPLLEMFFDKAYPDFLLRAASDAHAAFRRESRMQIINATVSTGNLGERSRDLCVELSLGKSSVRSGEEPTLPGHKNQDVAD
jgi:hypothetical protein